VSKPRRKPPTLRQKLASALLLMVRHDGFHDDGQARYVPVIPFEEARQLTADEIIARFEFDHGVYVTWGGSNHPTNLTPRLVPIHRAKTKRDRKNIDKVRRADKRRTGKKPKRPMPYAAMSRDFKRKVSGQVVKRAP